MRKEHRKACRGQSLLTVTMILMESSLRRDDDWEVSKDLLFKGKQDSLGDRLLAKERLQSMKLEFWICYMECSG